MASTWVKDLREIVRAYYEHQLLCCGVSPTPRSVYPRANDRQKWKDLTNDILSNMNQLTFRTALNAAIGNHGLNISSTPGTDPILLPPFAAKFSTNQTLHGIQASTVQIYKPDLLYLYIAMGIMIVAVLSVTTIFNRFWELGRPVSLAPLEVARSFGVPMLVEKGGGDVECGF